MFPLHEEPYDFWRPTPFALQYFAARHGLAVVHLERLGDGWDVLGTVIAASRPRARRAAGVLPALLLQFQRKVALAVLKSPFVHRHVEPRGSMYLCNVAVLERPA